MSRDPALIRGWASLPGHAGIEFVVASHNNASLRDTASGRLIGEVKPSGR